MERKKAPETWTRLNLDALRVRAALVDFALPEGEARLVGEAREEIDVLLLDEEVRVVDGDGRVGAGAQPKRLDLRVAVHQLGGQFVAVLRDDAQRRRLLALGERGGSREGHGQDCGDKLTHLLAPNPGKLR